MFACHSNRFYCTRNRNIGVPSQGGESQESPGQHYPAPRSAVLPAILVGVGAGANAQATPSSGAVDRTLVATAQHPQQAVAGSSSLVSPPPPATPGSAHAPPPVPLRRSAGAGVGPGATSTTSTTAAVAVSPPLVPRSLSTDASSSQASSAGAGAPAGVRNGIDDSELPVIPGLRNTLADLLGDPTYGSLPRDSVSSPSAEPWGTAESPYYAFTASSYVEGRDWVRGRKLGSGVFNLLLCRFCIQSQHIG